MHELDPLVVGERVQAREQHAHERLAGFRASAVRGFDPQSLELARGQFLGAVARGRAHDAEVSDRCLAVDGERVQARADRVAQEEVLEEGAVPVLRVRLAVEARDPLELLGAQARNRPDLRHASNSRSRSRHQASIPATDVTQAPDSTARSSVHS